MQKFKSKTEEKRGLTLPLAACTVCACPAHTRTMYSLCLPCSYKDDVQFVPALLIQGRCTVCICPAHTRTMYSLRLPCSCNDDVQFAPALLMQGRCTVCACPAHTRMCTVCFKFLFLPSPFCVSCDLTENS
jgi:hypothetical protein